MKKHLMCGVLVMGVALSVGRAQTPSGSSIVRLDPALDAIVSPDAKLEVLFEDRLATTEGPVWVKNGQYLLFSDISANRVYKWTPDGQRSVFLERSGFTGELSQLNLTPPPGGTGRPLVGSNGLALDREGRLILCTFVGDRSLVRLEKDGTRTTLADRYEGRPLDGPNDVAVKKSDGSIYFTDELSVFRWKDGTLQQLLKATVPGGNVVNGRPGGRVVNGIALSPDDRFLYVVVVPPAPTPRRIARYELRPDGTIIGQPQPGKTITDERVWVPLPDQTPPPTRESGMPDGIKVDLKGNVYFGGPGGLWIVSSEGKHLGTIPIPGGHTNLGFGDADGKGLYVTLGPGLARIRLNARGI